MSVKNLRNKARVRSRPRWRVGIRWVLPLVLVLSAVAVGTVTGRIESRLASQWPVERPGPFHVARIDPYSSDVVASDRLAPIPVETPFRPGETLGQVLSRLPLDPAETLELTEEIGRWADLRRLRPIDRYAAVFDGSGERVQGFRLAVAGKGRAILERGEPGWQGRFEPFSQRVEFSSVSGELEGSLEGSIRAAGGEAVLAYELAEVLQWDLDFTRDLRIGDRFDIHYERRYVDGMYDSIGSILAAVYQNGGRRIEAYRFEDEDGAPGYYDAEGRPIKKMFLRSPLRYSRVTSQFSHRRFHPILKRYRPHLGVDYGAPTGTPVRVTANGVVTSAGRSGGSGNMVKVRHPNGYLTAYLHLSRFAKGIRSGRRVTQGEVIGYVGATGLATAPHLDYRVQRGGEWINPLSIKSVPTDPIPESRMADFRSRRDALRLNLSPRDWNPVGSEPSRVASREGPGPSPEAGR